MSIHKRNDHTYVWYWIPNGPADSYNDWNTGFYVQSDGDKIIEFEDDEQALLWFKLNY